MLRDKQDSSAQEFLQVSLLPCTGPVQLSRGPEQGYAAVRIQGLTLTSSSESAAAAACHLVQLNMAKSFVLLLLLQGHTGRVSCLALSPSGRLLASGQITYLGFTAGAHRIDRGSFQQQRFSCRNWRPVCAQL